MFKRVAALLTMTALVAAAGSAAAVGTPVGSGNGRFADTLSGHSTKSNGWIRYHQPDFSLDAGEGCDFGVKVKVVRDREFYKDVAFYSDGTVKTQLWKGPLVMDFTNTDTGATIRRNLSGRSIQEYAANGDFASILIQHGHFAAVLPPGSDPGFGFYRVSGAWSSLTVNPDGTRTIALGIDGTAENLCNAMAAGS
jgi:hypothetical protein